MAYGSRQEYIPTLQMALEQTTVEPLKGYVTLLTKTRGVGRKAELIAEIIKLMSGANLQKVWSCLNTLQQSVVAETVHSYGGCFDRDRFEAKYGTLPTWEKSYLNLFIFSGVIPEDLQKQLETFVPIPEENKLETTDEIPEVIKKPRNNQGYRTPNTVKDTDYLDITVVETEHSVFHDLQVVLDLVEAGKITVSDKTRQPTATTVRAVAGLLLGGDYYDDTKLNKYQDPIGSIKPFAWPLIMQASGFADLVGKKLQLSKAGQRAMNTAPEKLLRTAWKRWLKTRILDEFRRTDQVKGQTGKGKSGFTALSDRRVNINTVLSECPLGEWVEVDTFFRYIRSADWDFEVHRNPWHLYISDTHYGNLGYDGEWEILQGRYVLCLLFEYAATMGLIDVAYIPPHGVRSDFHDSWGTDDMDFLSRYDGLLYFRLNALGAYCLELTDHYVPSVPIAEGNLHVMPNLELVATGASLPPGDIFLLDTYTKQVSDGVWKLDHETIMKAVENGQDLDKFTQWLQVCCAEDMPGPVSVFFAEVKKRSGAMKNQGMARMMECTDPALATLIAKDTKTRKYCHLVGDRTLVIPVDQEPRFRTALRKLGYIFPK